MADHDSAAQEGRFAQFPQMGGKGHGGGDIGPQAASEAGIRESWAEEMKKSDHRL